MELTFEAVYQNGVSGCQCIYPPFQATTFTDRPPPIYSNGSNA